ncbi:Uncharacterized conserved protein, DUF885 familyt [Amycolatopsis arida]|uniref:Uncharacterized conserved protein, DUF885 familyt n=1 Tax=Amycolatopsis arida TaxID=587909 RepID=A0A1I5XIK0_9PSEU|nr:DUF885 domain-containing protein [Amycolatopsis arida]TDX97425.1 uncharacterized protein (DUF885 family) [Amycolatopsis arida]SFQ31788.1 Uncharacterized conserved protein, DUF885 familyt [Amycolatopsis arida]
MTDVVSFADELVELMFDAQPLSPALLGLESDRTGLADLSEEAERTHRGRVLDLLRRLADVDRAALPEGDRVTANVVLHQGRAQIDVIDTRSVEFTVSDLFHAPAAGLLTLLPMVPVAGDRQARAQLDRLAAIPRYLEQALDRHRAGAAAGRVPVAHLVHAAVAHLDRYLAAPERDPLRRQPAPNAEFDRERERLLADVVRPAFAAYRDGLATDIAPHGRPADRPGVCWLPGGERIYASLARVHTTVTHRTPDELHETGLAVIEGLAAEYREIGSRVFGSTDLGEIFTRLRTDPALRWRDADELLDTARAAITRAEAAAPNWFGRVPPQPCVVEPVPAAEAPGAPAAYYLLPAADGSRPGTYFANTHEVTERFRHTAEATAFHEAVPGHHFQLSTALGLAELPLLRRIGDFTAYVEGWGLYSERLAHEMGLYSGDVALLGMLSMDSLRAGRLVVDTGLHAKGWSRERAVAFLREHTPMPPVEIESEVDRYITYPGQALAYMVGRLELQEMRATAEKALGDRFDIRRFHDLVLGGGALPLPVLHTVVTSWAEGNR